MKTINYLRLVGHRLNQAKGYANKIGRKSEADRILITGINAALAALDEALEPHLIKCEGKEPLTEDEEALFEKLDHILKLPAEDFAKLTHAQKFSAARVINRHGGVSAIQHPVAPATVLFPYLGISFPGISIGIEADGYAHS